MEIMLQAEGTEGANQAANAVARLNNETKSATVHQAAFSRQTMTTLQAVNKLQNAFFRTAFYVTRFAGANSQAAQTISAIAFGADVAIGVLQGYIAVTNLMRGTAAAATPVLVAKGTAEAGPAAPIVGPAIVAAVVGAAAAVAAFIASQSSSSPTSAAFGGSFDRPTNVVLGDSPWNPEHVLNSRQMAQLAGSGGGGVNIDGRWFDEQQERRRGLAQRRTMGGFA